MKNLAPTAAFLIVLFILLGCQKNDRSQTCIKGRVVAHRCMGTIIQVIEGDFDPSLVTPKWRDTLKLQKGEPAPEISNVFKLRNPCKHLLDEGDEFHFKMLPGETENTCAYCLTLDLIPPSSANGIVICEEALPK